MNNLIDRLLTVGKARSRMNNLIDRRAAIETADVIWTAARELFLERLKDLPSADAVEVVRCKDCIYQTESWSGIKYCEAHGDHIGKDYDYCSNVRRKDNG